MVWKRCGTRRIDELANKQHADCFNRIFALFKYFCGKLLGGLGAPVDWANG